MAHCVPPLQHKTAARDAGQVYKYDLSMPLRGMYGLVEAVRERVQQHGCGDTVKVTGFGHVGDGNLQRASLMQVRMDGVRMYCPATQYADTERNVGRRD